MKVSLTFVAVILPLLVATVASAQSRADRTGSRQVAGSKRISMKLLSPVRPDTPGKTAYRPLLEEGAYRAFSKGVVGTLPLAPNLDFRVGIFKVIRSNQAERALARTQPMRDVAGTQERMAAAGINLSF